MVVQINVPQVFMDKEIPQPAAVFVLQVIIVQSELNIQNNISVPSIDMVVLEVLQRYAEVVAVLVPLQFPMDYLSIYLFASVKIQVILNHRRLKLVHVINVVLVITLIVT